MPDGVCVFTGTLLVTINKTNGKMLRIIMFENHKDELASKIYARVIII